MISSSVSELDFCRPLRNRLHDPSDLLLTQFPDRLVLPPEPPATGELPDATDEDDVLDDVGEGWDGSRAYEGLEGGVGRRGAVPRGGEDPDASRDLTIDEEVLEGFLGGGIKAEYARGRSVVD